MLDDTSTKEPPTAIDTSAIDLLTFEQLREWVRGYCKENMTNQKSVALGSGIAESTFTAFMSNKYQGNLQNVATKLRIWIKSEMGLGKRRLVLPAGPKFVETRSATIITAALEHAQAMPDLTAVIGGPGVGKTTSIENYRKHHPNVWVLTAEPMISSAYAMMEYLREELNIPQTTSHRLSRAIALKLQGTGGLIVIDEMQHLEVEAIEQLRSLYDRIGIGMVFCGNEYLWGRIDGGGRKDKCAQIFSRIGSRVVLPKPHVKDMDDLLDAAGVNDAGQRKYLKDVGGKPGALRSMMKTLVQAQMLAAGEEDPADQVLTKQHLIAAFTRLSGTEAVQ